MKRFLVSILAILYLATASGATVHLHYCMDKLIGVSLGENGEENHQCNKCGMTKKSNGGCCKDIYKVVKTDLAQQAAKVILQSSQIAAVGPNPTGYNFNTILFAQNGSVLPLSNAPPSVWQSCPIYIRVGNFRI
ncbi:MAG: hypothetical protein H0X33_05215 [Taibaiella sp.]|nr:hypothetical protein [Taibaiella sp.]